eukprot:SAG11_NODE_874_length_6773_cov_4.639114_2_plen_179_part_00
MFTHIMVIHFVFLGKKDDWMCSCRVVSVFLHRKRFSSSRLLLFLFRFVFLMHLHFVTPPEFCDSGKALADLSEEPRRFGASTNSKEYFEAPRVNSAHRGPQLVLRRVPARAGDSLTIFFIRHGERCVSTLSYGLFRSTGIVFNMLTRLCIWLLLNVGSQRMEQGKAGGQCQPHRRSQE